MDAPPKVRPGRPEMDLEEVPRCPVCGATGTTPLHAGALPDPLRPGESPRWTLVRCTDCGCARLDPRPSPETIGGAYLTYFTHRAPAGPIAPRGAAARARRALLNGYLRARFGYRARPATRLGRVVVPLVPWARGLAERQVRSVPAPVRPARLLDVGCANGEYLLQMRALGWEVEGVETDPQAVALAREAGLVVRQGLLEGVFPARSFDVVTLGHVIEHAHDPAAMLAECARVLRPGGLLWLATPNLEAAGHRAFGQDYVQLDPPRHLVLFTRQALRGLLERGGFDQIREAPRVPQALAWTFRRSLAIRRGAGSHPDRLPALPRGLLARAVLADLAAAARPRRAEEIVLVARRGPD